MFIAGRIYRCQEYSSFIHEIHCFLFVRFLKMGNSELFREHIEIISNPSIHISGYILYNIFVHLCEDNFLLHSVSVAGICIYIVFV